MYSSSIDNLIKQLKKLPSVGAHTAERFVFYWLKSGKKDVTELMIALKALTENVRSCEICWNFDDMSPCKICQDKKRDQSIVCVVEQVSNLAVIEATGEYKGSYHVLRDLLDPSDEDSLSQTKIPELLKRITKNKEGPAISEIILALNSNVFGETTMLYLIQKIKELNPEIKITRLARGLPMGSDIRYADEITLSKAMQNRTRE
jgi:recombination protein RecR